MVKDSQAVHHTAPSSSPAWPPRLALQNRMGTARESKTQRRPKPQQQEAHAAGGRQGATALACPNLAAPRVISASLNCCSLATARMRRWLGWIRSPARRWACLRWQQFGLRQQRYRSSA